MRNTQRRRNEVEYERMPKDNVIPFRPRPPSDNELDAYRTMTRLWHPQMRQLMFPKYFEQDRSAPPENKSPEGG